MFALCTFNAVGSCTTSERLFLEVSRLRLLHRSNRGIQSENGKMAGSTCVYQKVDAHMREEQVEEKRSHFVWTPAQEKIGLRNQASYRPGEKFVNVISMSRRKGLCYSSLWFQCVL